MIIQNRYKIIKILDQNDISTVYKAQDLFHEYEIVLKELTISEEYENYEFELKRRAELEYKLLSTINHKNVVKAHHFFHENNSTYLVIDYVPGNSLEEILNTQKDTFSLQEKIKIFMQIANGLSAIHDAQVIHRDIKPGNIIIKYKTQQPMILDLGVSKSFSGDFSNITKNDDIVGTVFYMSPEQIKGDTTISSDIFSLGVSMHQFFLWNNCSPFFERQQMKAIDKILYERIPSVAEKLNTEKSNQTYIEISNLIDQMLAKTPGERINISNVLSVLETLI
ncbi:serine/threonine protein kinase [Candidatus Uabimicrobium sp. HlEnr_7]|uniref:serine/threonine protein kinase n=1 Tax=Candidatus Uabimicrobium helgolandensis TaxID=3095367 RepID=UPI003558CB89